MMLTACCYYMKCLMSIYRNMTVRGRNTKFVSTCEFSVLYFRLAVVADDKRGQVSRLWPLPISAGTSVCPGLSRPASLPTQHPLGNLALRPGSNGVDSSTLYKITSHSAIIWQVEWVGFRAGSPALPGRSPPWGCQGGGIKLEATYRPSQRKKYSGKNPNFQR